MATTEKVMWGITGGSGQLACSIVELLNQKGIPNVAWSHAEVDVTNSSDVDRIVNYNPTILVNCAAWTNVDEAEERHQEVMQINCLGAENVASAAKKLNIPLIQISTNYVFSGNELRPWKIDDIANPVSVYGQSKLCGEKKTLELHRNSSYILRTGWLYGPNGKNFAKNVLKRLHTSSVDMKIVCDQFGQPTTTMDLAEQIYKLIEFDVPFGTYHATNSGQASWYEFAVEIVKLSGLNKNRITPVLSSEFPAKAKRPKYSVLDNSMWENLGLECMKDWKDALREEFPQILRQVETEIGSV